MSALVLIAESDPFNLRVLQEICEAAGHTVVTAMDGTAALEVVARKRPDLVLVDVGLPTAEDGFDAVVRGHVLAEGGGLEIVRLLKSDQRLASIPVLLTANEQDELTWRRGIELGAEDYLSRPYRVFEIHHRVRNTLRRALLERIRDADDVSRMMAGQLPITLDYEMVRATRFGHALACVALTCSNFAHLRDAIGDDALGKAMQASLAGVRQCVRTIDHVFAASEREIVVVLPETTATEAEVVVHRIVTRLPADGTGRLPSFAVGVAGRVEGAHTTGLELLAAAKRAQSSKSVR